MIVFSNSVVKDDGEAFAISVALNLCRERCWVIVALYATRHLKWDCTSDTSHNLADSLTGGKMAHRVEELGELAVNEES